MFEYPDTAAGQAEFGADPAGRVTQPDDDGGAGSRRQPELLGARLPDRALRRPPGDDDRAAELRGWANRSPSPGRGARAKAPEPRSKGRGSLLVPPTCVRCGSAGEDPKDPKPGYRDCIELTSAFRPMVPGPKRVGQCEPDREGRPGVRAAFDVDPAVLLVVRRSPCRPPKPRPVPASPDSSAACPTVETLEEVRQVLLRDGRLRVVDPNGGVAAAAGLVDPGADRHDRPGWRSSPPHFRSHS